MDKNKILNFLQQSAFFRSLTKESQKTLLKNWNNFNEDQLRKIYFLTVMERVFIRDLAKLGKSLIKRRKSENRKKVLQYFEKRNSEKEKTQLEDLLNKANGST